jgi:hypothetical protein
MELNTAIKVDGKKINEQVSKSNKDDKVRENDKEISLVTLPENNEEPKIHRVTKYIESPYIPTCLHKGLKLLRDKYQDVYILGAGYIYNNKIGDAQIGLTETLKKYELDNSNVGGKRAIEEEAGLTCDLEKLEYFSKDYCPKYRKTFTTFAINISDCITLNSIPKSNNKLDSFEKCIVYIYGSKSQMEEKMQNTKLKWGQAEQICYYIIINIDYAIDKTTHTKTRSRSKSPKYH